MDIALRNAILIDGSGEPGRAGDLGIADGRIVAVGQVEGRARDEIDVGGAAIAPGFIDVHTHYDAQAFWDRMLSPSVFHGVTSVIAGNCGFTLAPLSGRPEDTDYLVRMLSRVEGMPLATLRESLKPDWTSFGEYLDKIDGTLAINTAFMVGHSAVRRTVMGERAVGQEATPEDIAQMCALLDRSIAEGGVGFSTTVSYNHTDYEGQPVPSRWATRDEILTLSRVVRDRPGTWLELVFGVDTFTEKEYSLATDMSLAAQRGLNWNLLVAVSSRKASYFSQLKAGDYANDRGAKVYALVTATPPKVIFNFATGVLIEGIPDWGDVMGLPHAEKRRALADPAMRKRLVEGHARLQNELFIRFFGDWGAMTLEAVTLPHNEKWVGRTVADYAAAKGLPPLEALLDLAVEEDLKVFFAAPLLGNDDESWDMRARAWLDDRCIIGASDAGAHLDVLNTFAFATQLLGEGVRERRLLSLEEAVRRITSVPAARFGLKGRGRLEPGAAADIVVFDPSTVACGPIAMRADLPGGEARLYADAVGIQQVIVNGVPVVRDGAPTGHVGGRVLRSGRDTETVPLHS
jgi:N-acyl-D-aspartate/D-glutamate deacylase